MAGNGDGGLCIPYTIRNTPDKGRGVFSDSAIRKGTIVWRHLSGQYVVYDESSLKTLLANSSHSEAVYELTHIFCVTEFPGYMIRVFDDGELINHSDQPNIVTNTASENYKVPTVTSVQDVEEALLDSRFSLFASQDLEVGDELNLDYSADPEDPLYYDSLCEQYGVTWEWL